MEEDHTPEHWNELAEANGYGWENIETGLTVGVQPAEEGDGWIVRTENHTLYETETKDEARDKAVNWILNHPRPTNF